MAYKFAPEESVRHAIFRCSAEQLDRAVFELSEGINTDPVDAIHTARKAIKKQRSLLRLARGAMPREQRRRENAALREAARSVSGVRDADVMIASISQLSERFAGQVPDTVFGTIRGYLEARRSTDPRNGSPLVERRVLQELAAVRSRADVWQFRSEGWNALDSGLTRSYKDGRQAFARARAGGEIEDLHAWRKRVKDLWYHQRLLGPTCGPSVAGNAKELDRLSDLLGDDHDLALLKKELTEGGMPLAVDLDPVVGLIGYRRGELQTEAFHIGQRVYAETPKAFRRRMRTCWKAGRALAGVPQNRRPPQLAAATRRRDFGSVM
jgi:CHAD domain-containing protein